MVGRIAAALSICVCFVAGSWTGQMAACAQTASSAGYAHPRSFGLELARPTGWYSATGQKMPHRLPGTFLAGWTSPSTLGNSVIYVLGRRYDSSFTNEQAANTVVGEMARSGGSPQMHVSATLLGLPGFAASVTAPGNGMAVNGVGGAQKLGELPTLLGVLGVVKDRTDGQTGSELILFAVTCPAASEAGCRAAVREIVDASRLLSDEPAATGTGGPAGQVDTPPAVERVDVPVSTPPATGSSAASTSTGTPRNTIAGFYVNVQAPPNWRPAAAQEAPEQGEWTFIAAWRRATQHGNACVYVSGKRIEGKFMVAQLGETMHESYTENGLEADLSGDLTLLGRPGFMLSVWGQGTGLAINGIGGQGGSGTTPTFLRQLILADPWAGTTDGADLIQFAAVGPLKAVDECLAALAHAVDNASLTGSYTPPSATPAITPPVEEPPPSPASTGIPAASEAQTFGSIYSVTGGAVRTRPLWVLAARDSNGTEVWSLPADLPSDAVVILISSDGMRAWLLTAADLQSMAGGPGQPRELTRSDALIPFRANWGELLR